MTNKRQRMHRRQCVYTVVVRNLCITGLLMAGGVPVAADTAAVEITRSGRAIMLDGFLMEWRMRTARAWGGDRTWLWDAATTPEGVAGYVRMQFAPPCSGWVIGFSGPSIDAPFEVRLPADSIVQSDFVKMADDGSGAYTLEWLFPRSQRRINNDTPFVLTIGGRCRGGDTLPVLVLRAAHAGKKFPARESLIGRAVLISILAAMYFFTLRKIRHHTGQGGPPRHPG
ncbi:MAG: hypothetical protein JXA18_01450 [Chitinispirillaceae bacterium]|nr:hypothetical protein [Chitinispirillaceae bacterium]